MLGSIDVVSESVLRAFQNAINEPPITVSELGIQGISWVNTWDWISKKFETCEGKPWTELAKWAEGIFAELQETEVLYDKLDRREQLAWEAAVRFFTTLYVAEQEDDLSGLGDMETSWSDWVDREYNREKGIISERDAKSEKGCEDSGTSGFGESTEETELRNARDDGGGSGVLHGLDRGESVGPANNGICDRGGSMGSGPIHTSSSSTQLLTERWSATYF